MNYFLLKNYLNYNDLFLEVTIGTFYVSEEEATRIANEYDIVLNKEGLSLYADNRETILIRSHEIEKYQFQICTKETKPIPVSELKKMSTTEIQELLFSDAYMTTDEDYKDIDLNLEEAFSLLQKAYAKKENFRFDSLAYSIQESDPIITR